MNKNEIYNNDINDKFEILKKEIELLKSEDDNNKAIIKKNEDNIKNLNLQLLNLQNAQLKEEELKRNIEKLKENIEQIKEEHKRNIEQLKENIDQLKEEHKRNIEKLKEDYNNKFKSLLKDKIEDKDIKPKNEIIFNNNNNNKNDINKKGVNKKKANSPKKKSLTEKETSKIREIEKLYETKLIQIFINENKNSKTNDLNDLKKISTALIIKDKNPAETLILFLNKNNIDNNDENKEVQKTFINNKKEEILMIIKNTYSFALLNDIDKTKIDEFIKEFREICGITEEDIKNKEIEKEIKKNKYNRKNAIESILLKIKYFNRKEINK